MADQPFSGRFTSLLLEGLAHYRKGEMGEAMRSWEAAYHTEAGNPQAREFLRTALQRLHTEREKDSGAPHPWLPDKGTAPPAPPPTAPGVSPWDQGPSRALPDPAPSVAPRVRQPPAPPASPPRETVRALTPVSSPRLAQPPVRDVSRTTDEFARPGQLADQRAQQRFSPAGNAEVARAPAQPSRETTGRIATPAETRKLSAVPQQAPVVPLPAPARRLATPLPLPRAAPAGLPQMARRAPPPPPAAALDPWAPDPSDPGLLGHAGAELNEAWTEAEQLHEENAAQHTASHTSALLREARQRVSMRDFSGALELTAQVLAHEPGHPEAHLLESECEAGLSDAYEASLGRLTQKPRVLMSQIQLLRLNLDASAGFVLSQVDGTVSYEDLFSICGLPRLDVARILARLLREAVIGV